ncbi:hypothetical protein L3Q82_005877 [Scortum barcoo]|uniref:Uncharacterized protein n=1 Tax=Scortum barcoo TaxID=214431 RepID=A0ACB8V9X6_9TELE|nr:hypothetical protein L3Q82_005877 [Scortum barcoo]
MDRSLINDFYQRHPDESGPLGVGPNGGQLKPGVEAKESAKVTSTTVHHGNRIQGTSRDKTRHPGGAEEEIPRGCKAGAKLKAEPTSEKSEALHKPSIPSVIMGNVNSLPNKIDELSALNNQRIYRESSLFIFTETWLNHLVPNANVDLLGFTAVRADRDTKASEGKAKVGDSSSVSLRPYYLPREFSHVITICVYIPPRADAATACEKIHSVTARLQTQHPEAFMIISGDFNHATLDSTLAVFNQVVDCPTRNNRTIDLLYVNVRDAYRSTPLPPLGKSDHNLVHHLQPLYTPLVQKQPVTTRSVRRWSPEKESALRDCFNTTVWDVLLNPHGEDIEGMTHCLTDYLNFCMQTWSPLSRLSAATQITSHWVTREVKTVLNKKRAAFRSRDREAMKAAQQEVKHCVKEAKDSHRRKGGAEAEGKQHEGDTTTPPSSSPTSTQSSPLITTDQVRGQLRKLRPRKAAGPDKVCPRLLKTCAAELGEPLQRIFNLSLQIGRVPTLWKTSRIVPVPKKNRPSELNDFRPVALTSHLMKTLERLFLSLLRPQVQHAQDRLQFAYQPGVGVEDAILYLLHRAHSHLDKGSGTVRILFLDFSSAFNTIQPTLLRDKLSRMGVDPQLMDWISDYLTGRPQYVGLKDITSDTVVSSTGAPQGTVLAPLLFTLYTSDFCYNSELCHIQKYADDTAIVGCIRDDREEEYRRLVGDFAAWCHTNHLQLNTSKTKELVIDFGRSRPRPRPVLLEGAEVEAVDSLQIPRAMDRQ